MPLLVLDEPGEQRARSGVADDLQFHLEEAGVDQIVQLICSTMG